MLWHCNLCLRLGQSLHNDHLIVVEEFVSPFDPGSRVAGGHRSCNGLKRQTGPSWGVMGPWSSSKASAWCPPWRPVRPSRRVTWLWTCICMDMLEVMTAAYITCRAVVLSLHCCVRLKPPRLSLLQTTRTSSCVGSVRNSSILCQPLWHTRGSSASRVRPPCPQCLWPPPSPTHPFRPSALDHRLLPTDRWGKLGFFM